MLAFIAMAGATFGFGLLQKAKSLDLFCAASVDMAAYGCWQLTYSISQSSFEIIAVKSVTLTSPSIDTSIGVVNERSLPASFGLGLVPGVFGWAMLAGVLRGEAHIQRLEPEVLMERHLIGGALMGFGSMFAGGCAVGAGLSGGAIPALTAWVAVFFM